tara:strand:+ start:1276 stop:2550 length:1275 start_codon:yes stop_codon:yes gene_type:complete
MKNKKIINEDITRIHEIMGISGKLLTEQPIQLIPKPLIKKALKMSDDVLEPLTKLFNLTDNQIDDVIRRIDIDGIDNLSDDVLEILSKSTIDNVDDLVRFMRAGKFFGSNFDTIGSRILSNADKYDEITPAIRKRYVDYFSKKLDELPFLNGADDIKTKLVRDFKSEFDNVYTNKLVRATSSALDSELDDLFAQSDEIMGELNDVVKGIPSNTPGREKIQTLWKKIFYSKESAYDEIRRKAGYIDAKKYERAGNIKGMTNTEIEKLLGVSGDGMRIPRDEELVKAISAAQNANYFTSASSAFMHLPKAIRIAFWTVVVSGGSALALGSSIIKILVGLMNIGSEKLDTITVSTDLISLNKDNIINHLSTKLGVPIETIGTWGIIISQDKKTATVEDPAFDGKIYEIKLNEVEDEPERNTITSKEA